MKFVYAIRELNWTIGKQPDYPRGALQCGTASIFLLKRSTRHAVLQFNTYVCVAFVVSEYAWDRLSPALYRTASYKYGLLIVCDVSCFLNTFNAVRALLSLQFIQKNRFPSFVQYFKRFQHRDRPCK